jgi:hypothetical protein
MEGMENNIMSNKYILLKLFNIYKYTYPNLDNNPNA